MTARPAAARCARLALGAAAALGLGLAAPAAAAAAEPEAAAAAEPAPAKSIAIHVEGKDADSIRSAIQAIVPETLGVVEPDVFTAALRKAGARPPIGALLLAKSRRERTLGQFRKALAGAKVEAVVIGVVRRGRSGTELVLLYVDPIEGDLAVDEVIQVKGDADLLVAIEGALGPALKEIAPPPPPEEKPPPPPPAPEPVEPAGERPRHDPRTALFAVELGFELGGRWFRYSDGITQNLRPYDVFGAPTVAVGGEVYPLAGSAIPVMKDLGITLSYARALGLSSSTEGGDPVTTTYQRFGAGLRFRYPLMPGALVGGSLGFRLIQFSFDAPDPLAAEVPEVSYAALRLGVDGRVPAGPVALTAMMEFLGPLSSGEVYDRFRGASVLGVGCGGGVIYPAFEGVEVRLSIEYTRFFSAFTPELGDPYIAGGALDHFLGIRLAGAYID
ncbi:MAG: hypothetical protein IT372_39785 [Polyangiaceae bacterium]|nr:hypothetical protein [Polyangiaceae bacterium]